MCEISEKDGGLLSHEAAKAITVHFRRAFYYAGAGSDQHREHLHCNQDGHRVPGMMKDKDAWQEELAAECLGIG